MADPNYTIITSPSGARFRVATIAAPRFQALVNDLEGAGYPIDRRQSGGYNKRYIDGTKTPSLHSFGKAIDINWTNNARGKRGDIPEDLALSLAKKHGLTWGGTWNNRDDMHFEFSDGAPVAMANRGLTTAAGLTQPTSAVAGASQTQPTTTGAAQPMPTYKDVGGQAPQYMGPQAALSSQKLAQSLMQQGMNPGPMRHWTEALGSVLLSGVGGIRNDMAMKDMKEGQAAGNQALAAMLMGQDPSAAMGNPYSSDQALKFQMAERQRAQKTADAERLLKMKLDAEAADPMRQLQMRNLESQIKWRESGGVTGMKAATKAEEEAAKKAEGKTALSDQLGSMVANYLKLDELGGVSNPDRGALENAKIWGETTGIGQMFGRALGSENQSLRERIVNMRPLLVQQIRQATGMSARGMDSNRELEFYLQAASDPTKDVYSNLAAIAVLDKTYGAGNLLEDMRDKGQLPKDIYERVKGQAQLLNAQRPIPTEPTAPQTTTLPAVDVNQDPAEAPPAPGARKAPDGNWYVEDPNRPGKYLMVE